MSSAPGISLFQGGDSIHLNRSLELAEEEEELEDQIRRGEELGNLLQNAFDDLDEDDTTMDCTTNFQSELAKMQQQRQQDVQQKCKQQVLHEEKLHELQMLLDSQTCELENIKKIASDESNKRNELHKRLTIMEAEMDRALATKKNTHELLVESKEKCSNLENKVLKVREEKKTLEAENNDLLGKLETVQTLLSDVQRKYDMVERDLSKQKDRKVDLRQKQMEERHRAEIEILQQQLDQLANKLDRKCGELENMNTRYYALQTSHEQMLVEKSSRLIESQRQCDELLSKPDYFQENVRLQKSVTSLQEQCQTKELTIVTLQERLKGTTVDLDLMDSILPQDKVHTEISSRLSDDRVVGSIPLDTTSKLKEELHRALANVKRKRDEVCKLEKALQETNTELRKLRDKENRALVQITTQKDENIRLENRLHVLEDECDQVRLTASQDNSEKLLHLQDEICQLRADKSSQEQKQGLLEMEFDKRAAECRRLNTELKNNIINLEELRLEHENMKLKYEQLLQENQNFHNQINTDSVRLEVERYKFLLKDAHTECDRLKNLYVKISNDKEALAFEIEELRGTDSVKELFAEREKNAKLQRVLQLNELKSSELTKRLECEKNCYEQEIKELRGKIDQTTKGMNKETKPCNKCIDYKAEITQNLQLSNINLINKKEMDELFTQLKESKALVCELTEKIALSNQQETLIKELKTKAQQFEEYIRNHNSNSSSGCSDVATSPHNQFRHTDKTVTFSNAELKRIETRIRDEMAKIFAIELKRCQLRMQHADEANHVLQRKCRHVYAEWQQQHAEVELLKHAIVAERDHMNDLLHKKDIDCQTMAEKQNALLRNCRDELQMKTAKINEIVAELEERQAQIEAERQSMKAVMAQWEAQRKQADHIERNWCARLQEMRCTHESATASWQNKLYSAKRTIHNYKRYAEDQEAHMRKEYERLRSEYDASVAKVEARMKHLLEERYNKVLITTRGGKE